MSRCMNLLAPIGRLVLTLTVFVCFSYSASAENWPQEFETEGARVILYQPQVDALVGDRLSSRAAVAVEPKDGGEVIFGAIWMEARIATDLDSGMVVLSELDVPRTRFADVSEEQMTRLATLIETELPKRSIEISLERLSALLELADRKDLATEGFEDNPPEILFTQEPTVLVSIDGDPILLDLEGTEFKQVVNTAFFMVADRSGGQHYVFAGNETWYSAAQALGPYRVMVSVPERLRAIEPEELPEEEFGIEVSSTDADESTSEAEKAEEDPGPPALLISTVAMELIVSRGKPSYVPVVGGDLLAMDNTDSDVLLEVASNLHFVLLAGRWYACRGLEGPWEFVASDALPEIFAEIPVESDQGHLLTWVAGTDLAEEALLDAVIPQTAAVERTATTEVVYDGDPEFTAIEGTSLAYAVNTESQVIQEGTTYYCCDAGIWYVSKSANGPWKVATEIPEEIQAIPASSPVYNTKYVYIYDTTPEVVYVGYYPGYCHSYVYHGCVCYGTGWYYRPWYRRYYYPRFRTWGFHMRWNPVTGWAFGFSWRAGPFRFGVGRYGAGAWFGPVRPRAYRRGYARGWQRGYRRGARAGYRAGSRNSTKRNVYSSQRNQSKVRAQAQPKGSRDRATPTKRRNDVYTDRSGNVHRKNDQGTWQSRDGGKWNDTADGKAPSNGRDAGQRSEPVGPGAARGGDRTPDAGTGGTQTGGTRSGGTGSSRDSGSGRSTSGGSSRNLDRDASARQRGGQRSSGSRSGGSRSRGSGGRRGR